VKTYNIHPELTDFFNSVPHTIKEMGNMIVYGPCGSGKYSQVLYLLQKYSPTHLKYDKRITINTEKQSYIYRISDIHYEIDMGLLGCHSKVLWHELFFQIVDIISMKTDKTGILVCKNFHMIHSELLEVFYSYIQQSNKLMPSMYIRFILITEHISFIPNPILCCCEKIAIRKPSKKDYMNVLLPKDPLKNNPLDNIEDAFQMPDTVNIGGLIIGRVPKVSVCDAGSSDDEDNDCDSTSTVGSEETKEKHKLFVQKIGGSFSYDGKPSTENPRTPTQRGTSCSGVLAKYNISRESYKRAKTTIDEISEQNVMNLKELQLLTQIEMEQLPKDIFNIICDNIIHEITNSHTLVFTQFRENLYDIFIYNLDITECVWYILSHFIRIGSITNATEILPNIYTFLKYYNNNYRPIYHLESILFYLLLEVRKQQPVNENERKARISNTRATRNEFDRQYKRNTRKV
jgi:hypothetical protein